MSNWACRAAGRGKRLSEPSNYRKIEQVLNLLTAGCIAMREADFKAKLTSYDYPDKAETGSTE
jgi:hypothetical protein